MAGCPALGALVLPAIDKLSGVDDIDPYLEAVAALSEVDFVARYDHRFLLKRPLLPTMDVEEPTPDDGVGVYDTAPIDIRDAVPGLAALSSREEVALLGNWVQAWKIAPLVKREGNPFPDRLSLGRAGYCDVHIRLPFISKLHAHLLIDGRYYVLHTHSNNRLRLNGRVLDEGEKPMVGEGDRLGLGPLELELVSARRLYAILKTIEAA